VTDITERKQAQEAAELANEAKPEFFAEDQEAQHQTETGKKHPDGRETRDHAAPASG